MKLALISVSDKSNLTTLTKFLLDNQYHILSTGGTFKHICQNLSADDKKKVIQVSDYTGFPELLEGRVKTLHPKIYSGILYDPSKAKHQKDFEEFSQSNHSQFNLEKIDLVVCNLYPFSETVANKNSSPEDIIENIDIGGVSLIRAAAKNYKNVLVITNPNKYQSLMDTYKYYETLENFRKQLAADAFAHIAEYDQDIASYFNPKLRYRKYTQLEKLKYGCNPYQNNAFISTINDNKSPIEVLNGKPGYINYLDAFHSWLLVSEVYKSLGEICSASFKHTASAGVALGTEQLSELELKVYNVGEYDISESTAARAFVRARNCDPLSSFGDFIAINSIVDEVCALLIKREVTDGIIALGYTDEALEILKAKKGGNFYILRGDKINYNDIEFREIFGLAISQQPNQELVIENYVENIVTDNKDLPLGAKRDLILSTITLKYTPSNSIAIGYKGMVIGIGAGQQNRVDCIKLAGNKSRVFLMRQNPECIKLLDLFKGGVKRQEKVNAIIKYIHNDFNELELQNWRNLFVDGKITLLDDTIIEDYFYSLVGLSLSSDAFFPFRDNIDYSSKYGITYLVQPGGSVQDASVIDACNDYGMTMTLSNKRMFLH